MQEISCKLSHRSCHIFSRSATHEFLHMLNWACIPENNVFTFPMPNKNIQASIYIFLSERISWNHQTNFRFLTESIWTFYNFINLLKIWLESSWLHLPNNCNNITNRYKQVDNMIDKKIVSFPHVSKNIKSLHSVITYLHAHWYSFGHLIMERYYYIVSSLRIFIFNHRETQR